MQWPELGDVLFTALLLSSTDFHTNLALKGREIEWEKKKFLNPLLGLSAAKD